MLKDIRIPGSQIAKNCKVLHLLKSENELAQHHGMEPMYGREGQFKVINIVDAMFNLNDINAQ